MDLPPTVTITSSAAFKERPVLNPYAKRKFSFPISLHASALLSESTTLSARRRLSNVSDAVTRKLSSSIGWSKNAVPREVILQGKCLCSQYIRLRLKRSGIYNKKLGLQRLRSIVGISSVHVVRDIFPALLVAGEELEHLHPRIYNGISRQVSRTPGGELQTPEAGPILLTTISRILFKNNITWGKVISLFAISAGIAVDCVKQGHVEYLPKLIDGFGDVIEDELANWIMDNGGWIGISHKLSPATERFTALEWVTILLGVLIGLLLLTFFINNMFVVSKYIDPNQ